MSGTRPTWHCTLPVLLVLLVVAALAALQPAGASPEPGSVDAAHWRSRTSCKKMKEATKSAVSKAIWPTSMQITISGVPPPEFSSKVNGRIVPVGNFQTNLGALEYFYRLAGPLDPSDTTTYRVVAGTTCWMLCEPGKRQVAFEHIFTLTSPALQQAGYPFATYNISAIGLFVFDREGRICSYDWDLRRLGLVVQYAFTAPALAQNGGNQTAVNELTVQGICQAAAAFCTGNNTQITSQADCEKYLRSLPVGDWDDADQDNLTCRGLHAMLVPLRPAVHCPHIGKTGGGKCVTHPPNTLFTEDFSFCSA